MIKKISRAVELFAANFGLFSAIVLTIWLPGSILLVYLRLYVFPQTANGDEMRMLVQEIRVSSAIEMAFSPLYVGAIIYAASQLKQGLSVSYRQAMAHGAKRSFKLFSTRIGTGLIVLSGLIALIIPGVFLALRFALIDTIVVLDGVEGASARTLSTKFTEGKKWQILGAMTLSFIGIGIVITIVNIPIALANLVQNFIVLVIAECISNILFSLLVLVLFSFYWDAKHQQIDTPSTNF